MASAFSIKEVFAFTMPQVPSDKPGSRISYLIPRVGAQTNRAEPAFPGPGECRCARTVPAVSGTAEAALPLPIPHPGHQPDQPCLGLSQDKPQGSSSHPDALQPDKINYKSPNELLPGWLRHLQCCPLRSLIFPALGNYFGYKYHQGLAVSLLKVVCYSQQE